MTTRLHSPALLFAVAIVPLAGCPQPPPATGDRAPFVDEWTLEAELPAAQLSFLSIGDRISSDNFANRGDIEVRYVEGATTITVEMQRFTVASSQAAADEAFGRMQYWGYDAASPEKPSDDLAPSACDQPDIESCYIRSYYDGLFQPVRDGANFRITLPAGWEGDLDVTTSDNLEEGIDIYPDRSDVTIDGLNGNLAIDLDSGNVEVRVDPNIDHYAGCSANDTCVEMMYAMGCGCSEPTNITIENATGQSSNITVDLGNTQEWYTMILENRGMFSGGDSFVCNATIDCSPFASCEIDPAYANVPNQERAEVNYPGAPAVMGAGMRISVVSDQCSNVKYVDDVSDYGLEDLPEEKRGELLVCSGCL
jgi:hypothetical protein